MYMQSSANSVNSHRAIWATALTLAAFAAVGFVVREGMLSARADVRFRQAAQQRDLQAAQQRDAQVATLLALLEKDPRVRQNETRRLVEEISRYSSARELATAETHYARALYLYYCGNQQFAEAEAALRRTLELRPDWAAAHNTLAVVLFEMGREQEAQQEWFAALELDPGWSRPHSDMAIMFRRAGRYEDAMDALQAALALDPEGPVTNYNLGVMLDTLGQHDQAQAQYEKVLSLDNEIAPAHYNLACSYARKGLTEPALNHLATAININPRFREDARQDPDLIPLRHHPKFIALLSYHR